MSKSTSPEADLTDRHQSEKDFWNRNAQEAYSGAESYLIGEDQGYEKLFSSIVQFRSIPAFFGDLDGKRILELGCGNGWVSHYFGRSGAQALGCDISASLLAIGRRSALNSGMGDRVTFSTMAAELLALPDACMDFVFMNAALHHCDVERTCAEIARILKDDGRAAFIEDWAYHPGFRLYRKFTPASHTEHERALTWDDIETIRRTFRTCRLEHYQLAAVFSPGSRKQRILEAVDRVILGGLPFLRRYTRLVGIFVEK